MKKVLITGASRGIGKATAEKFLAEGWVVIGTSTSGSGWERTNLSWVRLDLEDPQSIAAAAQDLTARGPIDVLVNNAGYLDNPEDVEGAVLQIPTLRKTLEINLIGTIDLTERLLSALTDGAHIISVGSRWGSISEAKSSAAPAYGISKAGMSMYTKRLATRVHDRDITVSIINPGWVKTDMGGEEGDRTPEEPAQEIYTLATSDVPTGHFWYKGKEQAW